MFVLNTILTFFKFADAKIVAINIIFAVIKETKIEKQLKEEEKILESITEKKGILTRLIKSILKKQR